MQPYLNFRQIIGQLERLPFGILLSFKFNLIFVLLSREN